MVDIACGDLGSNIRCKWRIYIARDPDSNGICVCVLPQFNIPHADIRKIYLHFVTTTRIYMCLFFWCNVRWVLMTFALHARIYRDCQKKYKILTLRFLSKTLQFRNNIPHMWNTVVCARAYMIVITQNTFCREKTDI